MLEPWRRAYSQLGITGNVHQVLASSTQYHDSGTIDRLSSPGHHHQGIITCVIFTCASLPEYHHQGIIALKSPPGRFQNRKINKCLSKHLLKHSELQYSKVLIRQPTGLERVDHIWLFRLSWFFLSSFLWFLLSSTPPGGRSTSMTRSHGARMAVPSFSSTLRGWAVFSFQMSFAKKIQGTTGTTGEPHVILIGSCNPRFRRLPKRPKMTRATFTPRAEQS